MIVTGTDHSQIITDLNSKFPGFDLTDLTPERHFGGTYLKTPTTVPAIDYLPAVDFLFRLRPYLNFEAGLKQSGFFKDQVVVDLGAGREHFGLTMALYGSARGYIAVEPNSENIGTLAHNTSSGQISKVRVWSIAIQEDVETFLSRLPDKSVSFIISGLSNDLLAKRAPNFFESVRNGIERTLAPNGDIFWNMSDVRMLPESLSALRRAIETPPGRFTAYRHATQSILEHKIFLR